MRINSSERGCQLFENNLQLLYKQRENNQPLPYLICFCLIVLIMSLHSEAVCLKLRSDCLNLRTIMLVLNSSVYIFTATSGKDAFPEPYFLHHENKTVYIHLCTVEFVSHRFRRHIQKSPTFCTNDFVFKGCET